MKVVAAPPLAERSSVATRPVVRRRRPLPGGRAVFGGFLVAVAVVGTIAAQNAATGPPSTRYVVAAASLPAGRSVVLDDLTTRAIDLPEPLSGRAYRDPQQLVGRVLAATLAPGELVQVSALAQRGPRAGEREVSFTADPARSLGQRVSPGDLVDVYATAGQGQAESTTLIVRSVRVIDRQGRDGAGFIFTVALADAEEVESLVAAAAAGSLTVVRATAAQPSPGGG
ncbi:MAG: RcpC/CpaB family pilus assembly protein [Acidimicrobiales bacterium]